MPPKTPDKPLTSASPGKTVDLLADSKERRRARASKAAKKSERSTGSVYNPSSRQHIMTRTDEKSTISGGTVTSTKIPVTNPANRRSTPSMPSSAMSKYRNPSSAAVSRSSEGDYEVPSSHSSYTKVSWSGGKGNRGKPSMTTESKPAGSYVANGSSDNTGGSHAATSVASPPASGRAPSVESKTNPNVSTSQFRNSSAQPAKSRVPDSSVKSPLASPPKRSATHPGSDSSVRAPSNDMQNSSPGRIAKASIGAIGHGLASASAGAAKYTAKAVGHTAYADAGAALEIGIGAAKLGAKAAKTVRQKARNVAGHAYIDSAARGGSHVPSKISTPALVGAASRNYHEVSKNEVASGTGTGLRQKARNAAGGMYLDSVSRGGTHAPSKISTPSIAGAAARNFHETRNNVTPSKTPQPVRSRGTRINSNATEGRDYTVSKGNRNINPDQFGK